MKVKKTRIPSNSLILQYHPADYTDSFQITTEQNIKSSPDDIIISFWIDMPGWINILFQLRNFLVKFVGLENSNDKNVEELKNCIRNSGKYGFIEVPVKDETETVIIMKDKHLDAYMSVIKEDCTILYFNTLVHFNNKLGKIYFTLIRPFHSIVVRETIKHTIKKHI